MRDATIIGVWEVDAVVNRSVHYLLLTAAIALSASVTHIGAEETHDTPENVYFGDVHLHTRYSNDAFAFMTSRTPDDTYRFAGENPWNRLEVAGSSCMRLSISWRSRITLRASGCCIHS